MSAVKTAVEKVKALDEAKALELLTWLASQEQKSIESAPLGADAMLGFARRFREERRGTAEWMAELRDGESG